MSVEMPLRRPDIVPTVILDPMHANQPERALPLAITQQKSPEGGIAPAELFQQLADILAGNDSPTAIMAGHYMLAYDADQDRLAPLLRGDAALTSMPNREAILDDIADFPEATFELGARLVAKAGVENAKIVMLVNDRQFLMFQEGLPDSERLKKHRETYYRQAQVLPEAFMTCLQEHGLDLSCMVRNDARRSKSTLPSSSCVYSEQVLKRRFEDHRKEDLAARDDFRWTSYAMGSRKLVYQPPGARKKFCLLNTSADGDACGCSGVMVEFLMKMAKKNFQNLLLFIPNECRYQVHESIVATMQSLWRFKNVVSVWAEAGGGKANISFEGFTRYH